MQELPIIIESELRNGLRPRAYGRAAVNSPYLLNLEGLRVDELGLEPQPLPGDPFQGLVSVDWPFPQLFRGLETTLLLRRSAAQIVSEASNLWTTTNLTFNDAAAPASTKAIAEGGVWHIADLGGSWFAFNGSCTLFTTGLDPLFNITTQKYWIDDSVTIASGCAHKGRVIVGGLDSTLFSGTMSEILRQAQGYVEEDIITDWDDIASNYVLWGSIGGGDFPLWLFMPLSYPEAYRPTYARFVERLKRGQFGWAPCSFQGSVLALAPLGDSFVAYGEDGVTAFRGVAGGGDIPATYQVVEIPAGGVYDRGSVVAGPDFHTFFDNEGTLWRLDKNLSLTRLGFEEFFKEFVDGEEEVVPVFDPLYKDSYFSSLKRSFLVTTRGVSRSLYRFPNMVVWKGKRYATEKSKGDLTSKYASLQTNAFDVRNRYLKTVTSVNVGHRGGGTIEVALQYKYNNSDSWEQTSWVRVNDEGNAVIRVTALEHRVLVRASDPTTFQLEYITVKVQSPDKRFSRGPQEGTRVAREVQ